MPRYVLAHWRGDLGLMRSVFVNGALIYALRPGRT